MIRTYAWANAVLPHNTRRPRLPACLLISWLLVKLLSLLSTR
uniref:Uncharacterized protein n=1 Tax=Podoviridae sp. ct1h53 TaxID=2826536 RepID=A0A8S5MHD8_9CAUD|nr:MAG TPA: hypothetical protein [Podoviridae sp. ct1h53]